MKGMILLRSCNQSEKLYDVASSLLAAGLTLLTSFYICLHHPAVFSLFLPVFAVLLFVSIRFFRRHHQAFSEKEKSERPVSFYKGCTLLYFAFSLYLLSVGIIFFTAYSYGGYFVAWTCLPLSILCFIVCLQAEKEWKEAPSSTEIVNTDMA